METPERKLIRRVMKPGEWYTPSQLAELTGITRASLLHILRKMEAKNQIERPRTGRYMLPTE